MSFIESYFDLLILQYRNKPKAEETIKFQSQKYKELYDTIQKVNDAYDVDIAEGRQLDIIGKIVGINRTIPEVIPKVYFGFSEIGNTMGFGQAPFFRTFDEEFSDTELNDGDYRFFIKAKIAKNTVRAKMIDDNLSIQEAISFMFGASAYVSDNYDMTMTLFIDENYPTRLITFLNKLDLIPKPAAVRYKYSIIVSSKTFGFRENPNAVGFGQGKFARVQGVL